MVNSICKSPRRGKAERACSPPSRVPLRCRRTRGAFALRLPMMLDLPELCARLLLFCGPSELPAASVGLRGPARAAAPPGASAGALRRPADAQVAGARGARQELELEAPDARVVPAPRGRERRHARHPRPEARTPRQSPPPRRPSATLPQPGPPRPPPRATAQALTRRVTPEALPLQSGVLLEE